MLSVVFTETDTFQECNNGEKLCSILWHSTLLILQLLFSVDFECQQPMDVFYIRSYANDSAIDLQVGEFVDALR